MVRGGWYGREGQRRQRWWCHPKTGEPHRFTETLPRIVAATGDRHACPECSTTLEPWEGQPAPRLYGFTAKDIAWALTQVAEGATYRATAAAVRERAGRPLDARPGKSASGRALPPATQHGQLVSDWVEVYAPVIWSHYAPKTWPSEVLLDEDTVKFTRPGSPAGILAFYVVAAMGYQDNGRPYVAAVEAIPQLRQAAWTRFLRTLDGQPQWVVTDGGGPVLGGARRAWPDAELWRCEWHLARNLHSTLPERVRTDPEHPLRPLLTACQTSSQAWETYLQALRAHAGEAGFAGAIKSATRLDPLIRFQAGSRPDDLPLSTGPLEQFFNTSGQVIGKRASTMTNKARADALLKLIAARRNGWVNTEKWARILRDHLTDRRGRASLQRRRTDVRSSPSLR